MRILLTVVGLLLILSGCVWVLQGVNVIPGSFMTGQAKWTVNGAISIAVGLALLYVGRRMSKS